MSMKNPLTLAGIEPATFRFVAQHLNHCATAVPIVKKDLDEILSTMSITNGKKTLRLESELMEIYITCVHTH